MKIRYLPQELTKEYEMYVLYEKGYSLRNGIVKVICGLKLNYTGGKDF